MQNIAPNHDQNVQSSPIWTELQYAKVWSAVHCLKQFTHAYLNCHNSKSLREKLHKKPVKQFILLQIKGLVAVFLIIAFSLQEISTSLFLRFFFQQGNPMESAKSPDLNCHLRFLGRTYRTLPEAIGDLQTTPLHDEDSGEDIWCRRICPDLPFNNVMTPYKRTK